MASGKQGGEEKCIQEFGNTPQGLSLHSTSISLVTVVPAAMANVDVEQFSENVSLTLLLVSQ